MAIGSAGSGHALVLMSWYLSIGWLWFGFHAPPSHASCDPSVWQVMSHWLLGRASHYSYANSLRIEDVVSLMNSMKGTVHPPPR